jgi:hypothetical protein
VRPKKNFLELCLFLGRTLKAPQVRRSDVFALPFLIVVFTLQVETRFLLQGEIRQEAEGYPSRGAKSIPVTSGFHLHLEKTKGLSMAGRKKVVVFSQPG